MRRKHFGPTYNEALFRTNPTPPWERAQRRERKRYNRDAIQERRLGGIRTQYSHGRHGFYLTTCSNDPTMRRALHTNVKVGMWARFDGMWARVVAVGRPDPRRDTIFVGLSCWHHFAPPAGAVIAHQGIANA